jgi:hypothetical protein
MAKRRQKDSGLEISFAQKNKRREKDYWARYWFYVKTPGVKPKSEPSVKKYPFASIMGDMRPLSQSIWSMLNMKHTKNL